MHYVKYSLDIKIVLFMTWKYNCKRNAVKQEFDAVVAAVVATVAVAPEKHINNNTTLASALAIVMATATKSATAATVQKKIG